jgi:hypothetical protein
VVDFDDIPGNGRVAQGALEIEMVGGLNFLVAAHTIGEGRICMINVNWQPAHRHVARQARQFIMPFWRGSLMAPQTWKLMHDGVGNIGIFPPRDLMTDQALAFIMISRSQLFVAV